MNQKKMLLIPALALIAGSAALFAADTIYCKWCGSSNFATMQQLLTSPCNKSPRKYHDAYEGAEKASYTCKHCAAEYRSFKQLVLSPCNKSPRGYHDPL